MNNVFFSFSPACHKHGNPHPEYAETVSHKKSEAAVIPCNPPARRELRTTEPSGPSRHRILLGAELNYYTRHLGDFAKDTSHLSALQVGIYDLLLDRYYASEKPLPADEVYQVARCSTPEDRKEADKILKRFFQKAGKTWRNKRCDEEIAKFHAKQDKARNSANARWKPCERNANAMRTHSEGNALQYPITNNQSLKNPEAKNGLSELGKTVAQFTASHRVPRHDR